MNAANAGDRILVCFHNTRSFWSTAYHPGKNALYVPFQDQCLSMTANTKAKTGWGPRTGVMRPGIDPNKYMKIFEANKPMLTHPDKIYPGQELKIPI